MKPSNDLVTAVDRTIAYAQVFGHTPAQREVWHFLHLGRLVSSRELELVEQYRVLRSRANVSRVVLDKRRRIAEAVTVFSHIPWIKSVWLTGALAAGVAKDDDDLDFMFIVDSGKLWLARFLVVSLGMLLGKYRSRWLSWQSNKDRWCCNIWLEPGALALPVERQTLYEARELIQAVPIYVRPGERAALLLERNRWARRYCANGYHLALRRARSIPTLRGFLPISLFHYPELWLNLLLGWLQRRIMRGRISREVVRSQAAFFHPRDTRTWIRVRYEKICLTQGIKPWFNAPAP